jgi:hypothetical protein
MDCSRLEWLTQGSLHLVEKQTNEKHSHADHEQDAGKAHEAVVCGKEVDQCFHGYLLWERLHLRSISTKGHDLSQAYGTMLRHIEQDQHLEGV